MKNTISLDKEDIKINRLGLNLVITVSDTFLITLTPDAIRELVADAVRLGFVNFSDKG